MALSVLYAALSLLPAMALAGPVAGKTYTISPASHTDLCLAPSGSNAGTGLVVKNCDKSSDIVFTLEGKSIKNTETNMCYDIRDGGVWSGNAVQFWQCYSWNHNQQFDFVGNNIRWANTELCLDLKDGRAVDGNAVQIWQCYDGNVNQQWVFHEAQEVDGECEETPSPSVHAPSVTVTSSSTTSASAAKPTDSDDDENLPYCDEDESSTSASASITAAPSASIIGGGLFAGSSISKHDKSSRSSGDPSALATSSSDSWGSSSDSWSASASATGSVSASVSSASSVSSAPSASPTSGNGGGGSGNYDTSGYLRAQGAKIVDPSGKEVILKGVNIGGWLVDENWMNGITDNSNPDRFAQVTLEKRFGEQGARNLFNAWYDNYFTTADWDNIKAMGYNHVRLPFGFQNVQNLDGSWRSDAFTRMDWAIQQAKQRNIYVILVFHIWDTQQQSYSMISENTNEGAASRQRAGEIWKKVASRYRGENIIAGYDAINEPTGSYGDYLQRDLYTSIRSADPDRLIIMESINTNPANYGWTNVVYSMHEYLMMTDNYQGNIDAYYGPGMYGGGGTYQLIQQWRSWGVPIYAGEFMAMAQTLPWLIDELNKENIAWASWSYSTIDMGGWGLFNFPGSKRININQASYDDIMNMWSNLGRPNRNDNIYSVYTNGLGAGGGWKRDAEPDYNSTMSIDQAVIGVEAAGIAIKSTRRALPIHVTERANVNANVNVHAKRTPAPGGACPEATQHKRAVGGVPVGHRRSRRHTAGVVGATAF